VSDDVAVRLPDGTAGTVPASQVSQLPEGAKTMSAAEVAAEKKAIALNKKYELKGGNLSRAVAGRAGAFAVGAASVPTLGLSTYLASEYGGRDFLDDVRDSPTLEGWKTGGEVGGTLALAAATGGAGAAAEGAAAARLGGRLLARIGAAGARAGVEGFVQGAGSTVSEAALNNTDLTAESVLAGGLKAGGVNMLAGGALKSLGEGVSALRAPKPTAQAYENLAAGAYRTPAPGVGQALREEVEAGAPGARRGVARTFEETAPSVEVNIGPARQSASLSDKAADAIVANPLVKEEEKGVLKSVWERRESVLRNEDEALQSATRNFAKGLDEELAASRRVDMQSFGDAKVSQMAKLVDRGRLAEQSEALIDWMTDANATIQAIGKDATAGLGPTAVRQWDTYMAKLASAMERGDSVALHTTTDNLKRWVGKQAGFGKAGPFGLSVAQKEMDALYQGENGLMRLLESDVWGVQAAKSQREINAATSAYLNEGDLLKKKFTTQFGSEAGRPLYRADPASLSSHFGKLTDVAADLDAEGVRGYVSARRRMLDALEKNYTFDEGTASELQKAKGALDKMEATYETSVKDAALVNQVKKSLEAERARSIGGLAGAVLDTATKPYTTMQRLASLEQQTQNVLVKITGGTRKLVAEAEPGAIPAGLAPPKRSGPGFFSGLLDSASETARQLGRAKDQAKTAVSLGGSSLRSEYERRVDQINRIKGSPDVIADRVGTMLAENGTAAPKVTAAARMAAIRGVEFLASKLPHSREDPYSPQPHLQRPRASDAEIAQFSRYMEAVDDPTMVFTAAQKGTLTRDHVEAVKAVYPAIYAEMQTKIMESLAVSRSPLPFRKRIQLGILLDIPTDKTLSPEFMQAIQGTYKATGPQDAESPPPTLSRPLTVAGSLQTATQAATEGAE
jgi:hypothetical protein